MNFPGRISDDGPEWNDAPRDLTDEKHVETLQAENKRLRESLERCRSMRERGDATGGHACLYSALLLEVEKICEEALK